MNIMISNKKLRNIVMLVLASVILFVGSALIISKMGSKQDVKPIDFTIEESDLKAINELATMKCVYHNIAKVDKTIPKWWIFDKTQRFWVEYDAIVEVGVKTEGLKIKTNGMNISITIPKAEMLDYNIDRDTFGPDCFYVDKESQEPTAIDVQDALKVAKEDLEKKIVNDTTVLDNAQNQVKFLLERYIENIEKAMNVDYSVEWNLE